MKKKKTLSVLIISALFLVNCNKDDSSVATPTKNVNPIIGIWKLVEEHENGIALRLSDCSLEETYIFSAEQFVHEIYAVSQRPKEFFANDNSNSVTKNFSQDNNTAIKCEKDWQGVGSWSAQENNYTLKINGTTENRTIRFTNASHKFYYEETTTTFGVTKVKRYVYQRQ